MRTPSSIILMSVLLVVGLCGLTNAAGQTVTSDKGLYRVGFESRVDPVPLNEIHAWVIKITDAQGRSVTGATISVDGGMPAHGHGLPTKPRMTQELGDGQYLVDGLKFQMPGEWVVDLTITAEPGADTARIDLSLGADSEQNAHSH